MGVGRYNLLTRLAVGGMAEIWLARQVGLQGFEKFVVIKRILDGLGTDPESVRMFLDEARIAAQLNHPHIVQIFDLGQEAGAFYIAMEYLPGENLSATARAGARQGQPMPISLAVRIIADAAEGLAYAHTKTGPDGVLLGIVHRDVSPQNLHITYDGVVKLVDFGIAKAANRESQTMVGQIKGKAAYMSPEQARGEELDGRSDIFSLGIILFELVTRTRLFRSPDPIMVMKEVASTEPLPLAHDINPKVPEALSRIIGQALARQPSKRYTTARQFQNALEEWLRTQPSVPGTAELGGYMSSLFSERMKERARLLEAARSGQLTSTTSQGARISTVESMPGRTGVPELETLRHQAPTRSLLLSLGAVGLLLAVGAGLFFAMRPAPVPPPPVPAAAPAPGPAAVPAPPVLTIETDPPGAQVLVDGEEAGHSPLTLEELSLGEHTVTATLEGRQQASRQVTLGHPGERTMVVLMLAPEPAAVPPAVPGPTATDPAATDPAHRPANPPKKVALGRLTLDTTPWTRVFLRGKRLGDTPIIDLALPAGRHQLKLVNEEKNISTVIEVEIRAGQSTAKKLRL